MSKKIKLEPANSKVMAATTTVFTAEEFDFKAVKKMTSFESAESETLIFSWPIVDNLQDRTATKENKKKWKSDLFRLKDDGGFAQLSMKHVKSLVKSYWTIALSTKGLDKNEASPALNSYFNLKCRFQDGENSFTEKFSLLSTIGNKIFATWRYTFHGTSTLRRTILVDVYQIPAAIPNYLSAKSSVNLGKVEIPKDVFPLEGEKIVMTNRAFTFGSADRNVVVTFLGDINSPDLSATLHVVNERAPGVPLIVTFNIFSGKSEVKDFVKEIVLCRDENVFDHSLLLALYEDIRGLLENDAFYYKVVLQPAPPSVVHV